MNKGYFRVQVYTNDGKGGRVQSQAEVNHFLKKLNIYFFLLIDLFVKAGSLIELGDRGGSYTHKAKGTYSSGRNLEF